MKAASRLGLCHVAPRSDISTAVRLRPPTGDGSTQQLSVTPNVQRRTVILLLLHVKFVLELTAANRWSSLPRMEEVLLNLVTLREHLFLVQWKSCQSVCSIQPGWNPSYSVVVTCNDSVFGFFLQPISSLTLTAPEMVCSRLT